MITREILDLPCALKADAVDWRVSSFSHNEFKRHLDVRIKRSCLRIFRELVSKEVSLQFSRKCMIHQSAIKCLVCCVAISKPYPSGSK